MQRLPRYYGQLAAAIGLALAVAACEHSPPAAPQPQVQAAAAQPAAFPPPPPDAADGIPGAVETWDSLAMRAGEQFVRVGYSRTTVVKTAGPAGQAVIRTCNFTRTILERAGQSVQQDLKVVSLDTPDGRLVAFETQMGEIATTGLVQGDQLQISTTSAGRTQKTSIPWQAEWGGLFAAEQSVRRQPLTTGERRTVRGLVPMLNVPGDTVLAAGDDETVDLPGGPRKLLKVQATMQIGSQQIESTQWADERGETLKAVVPAVGQETLRTTKDDALRRTAGGKLDLLVNSTVPLAGGFPNAQRTKKAVYLANVKNGKIDGVFSNSLSQHVAIKDDRTAEVTVIAVRPNDPKVAGRVPSPTADDQSPSSYIQSDDPAIIRLANSVANGETDSWTIACALEKHVDSTIKLKNFSQAFSTAAEVARTLEGDCTEHAVLFAALCRARNIPARCAFGLIYFEPLKGFAFHMWNEVWIGDRWVPMDPTLGQGGIAADHLQLGSTSLSGQAALADLLGVMTAFGRLELQLVAAE
ncbi:MAG TPA: transglutaminase family protein [Pirellulaceae bacterium]|nr:transglutaminase family protein [Pirellulaceae bacterium]